MRNAMPDMPTLPAKIRELHNHHFDSTVWNDFTFRDDDIVIATYAKAGTTWTQQIVSQLLFDGDPTICPHDLSPWLDIRVVPAQVKYDMLEAQTHRRFIKTHLPVDALRFDRQARYIYIARDGRDVLWSLYNHHANGNADFYAMINDTPGRVGPPLPLAGDCIRSYFQNWLEKDGDPFWPSWENVRGWWAIRNLPNVRMVHFADMKRDPAGEIRGIADFLGINVEPERWPAIMEHCSFDWMKANAALTAPMGGSFFHGGAEAFINKGTNGRWRDVLTADDIAAYEARAIAELGEDCARWLAEGAA
jgi:aryl sulfotransferase